MIKFRDERNWKQFHNPKDLAISISIEAEELLEAFQWIGSDNGTDKKENKIREELADVFIYSILMLEACGMDFEEIVQEKLKISKTKYPIDQSFGSNRKYTAFTEDQKGK